MDLRARQQLHNGFGDALARAFEMVITPGVFGFLGYLVDGWLGTAPLFMLTLALFTFGYVMWKFWSVYERHMQAHEAELRLRRQQRRMSTSTERDHG